MELKLITLMNLSQTNVLLEFSPNCKCSRQFTTVLFGFRLRRKEIHLTNSWFLISYQSWTNPLLHIVTIAKFLKTCRVSVQILPYQSVSILHLISWSELLVEERDITTRNQLPLVLFMVDSKFRNSVNWVISALSLGWIFCVRRFPWIYTCNFALL